MADTVQTAVFGGGCFWCTEAVFAMLAGVTSVTPGYAGGAKPNPSYEEVSTGKTGHVEVVKVTYDPDKITFADLLTVFFATHDPTTPNRQGADVGTQYRSVIFHTTDTQRKEAERFIQTINDSNPQGNAVATEVRPLDAFWEAEAYHHEYYAKKPNQPYCQLVINPKLEKVRTQFAKLLEWKKVLTPEQYRIMREKGTERPGSGKLLYEKRKGEYHCGACGALLFSSDAKFDSDTGWPSFTKPTHRGDVILTEDAHYGIQSTEVRCSRCGSHLGHVFSDGPPEKGGKRYCINSVSLAFEKT